MSATQANGLPESWRLVGITFHEPDESYRPRPIITNRIYTKKMKAKEEKEKESEKAAAEPPASTAAEGERGGTRRKRPRTRTAEVMDTTDGEDVREHAARQSRRERRGTNGDASPPSFSFSWAFTQPATAGDANARDEWKHHSCNSSTAVSPPLRSFLMSANVAAIEFTPVTVSP